MQREGSSNPQQGSGWHRPQSSSYHHGGGGGHHGGPRSAGPNVTGGSKSGLFGFNSYNQRRFPIPLKSVTIRARVVDFFARVCVTQEYVNNERNPIEVSYTFPLTARSAVCAFSAEVNGRKIAGEVKENEEAADLYDDAISSGHGAFTGRSERPNVFTAVVGNLPPGQQATIHITYITELSLLRTKGSPAPRLRFMLPARLAPKPKPPRDASSSFFQQQKDSSAAAATTQKPGEFKLAIEVDLSLSSRITAVAASQPVSVELPTPERARVTLNTSRVRALKYDFVVDIGLQQHDEAAGKTYGLLEAPPASAAAKEDDGAYAAALVLYCNELFPAVKADAASAADVAAEHDDEDNENDNETEDDEGAASESEADAATKATTKGSTGKGQGKASITDVRLEWDVTAEAASKIKSTTLPAAIRPSSGVLFLYALVPAEVVPALGSEGASRGLLKATLRGKLGETDVHQDIFFHVQAQQGQDDSLLLHQLYARAVIRVLERGVEGRNEEEVKREVVELGVRYSLSSRYTTFVAVEERTEATEGSLQRRVVPLNGLGHRPSGGGRGRGRGGRGGAVATAAGDRSHYYGHDWRGGGGGRDARDVRDGRDGGRAGGQAFYDRERGGGYGARGGSRSGGGYQGQQPGGGHHQQQQQRVPLRKRLEVTAELADQVVALKTQGGDHWLLNSALAKLLDRNLTQVIDALVGVPIVDYVSNVWATALAAVVLAQPAAKEQHGEVLQRAEAWLEEETKKYFLDSASKWLAKARAFLNL